MMIAPTVMTLNSSAMCVASRPAVMSADCGPLHADPLTAGVQPLTGRPGAGTKQGSLASGALESSNVDLTSELVNLIVAQRSYQANAQTVKTQDQVMQTLMNIR